MHSSSNDPLVHTLPSLCTLVDPTPSECPSAHDPGAPDLSAWILVHSIRVHYDLVHTIIIHLSALSLILVHTLNISALAIGWMRVHWNGFLVNAIVS